MTRAMATAVLVGVALTAIVAATVALAERATLGAATGIVEADGPGPEVTNPLAVRSVVLVGTLATLVAVLVVQRVNHRRAASLRALAIHIQRLGEADDPTAITPPRERPAELDEVYRQIGETQERIRQRVMALESHRRRGFVVLSHMTDGVVAVSGQRRIQLLNPAARRLLALSREDAIGRRLAEVVRVPEVLAIVDHVLAGDAVDEAVVDLPNGRHLRALAVTLPTEDAPGVLITIRDETQIRQLETMRREFIANVSHELKTPLAAIKGYAETLQLGASEDPEACGHFLEQIGVQSNRLERLINDMLQLARAQTGPDHLALTTVPLLAVLREAVAAYEPLAHAKRIHVRLDPPLPGAAVWADREALLTIVNNLLGNAVRYTPEEGHVTLSARSEAERMRITVSDDGPGIPEEDQDRVFERFYRVEKARDSTRGGTGLGLAIVKNLVQALGGEVHLRSRLGQGAVFDVLLPSAPHPRHDRTP